MTDARAIEDAQRRALRRNKTRATALLLGAAAVFVATFLLPGAVPEPGFWLLLLRATAEASVVGGLADWFAVTAVFRRPLGLPIPHTAIVPRNKDRIGEGLGAFVAGNFLTPALLAAKLRAIGPAQRAAMWLAAPGNAVLVADRATQALPYLIRSLEDAEIRDFVARALGEQLRSADLSAALGNALGVATSGAPFDMLFDRVLDALQGTLDREAGTIVRIVEERAAWWVPKAVDRSIAKAIVAGLGELIADLRQPDGAQRLAFRLRLETLARDLVQSPAHRERLDRIKIQLLDEPEVKAWLAAIWDTLRTIVIDDLDNPQSKTREAVARAVLSFGRALLADPAMRERIDAALVEAAVKLVVPWRDEIGRFISEVVRGWEARTVTDRLELALGADLQHIRITGTLVGACVGALLFLISRLL